MKKIICFIVLLFLSFKVSAKPIVHVVQVVPVEFGSYTVQDQNKQISHAVDLAQTEFLKNNQCDFEIKKTFKIGDSSELYKTIQDAVVDSNTKRLVGFSRSTFSRIAAKAAKNSSVVGISIGASANDLRKINPNFYSIASDQKIQWGDIEGLLKEKSCTAENTVGVFQETDSYSYNFKKFYKSSGYKQSLSVLNSNHSKQNQLIKSNKCFLLGLNIAASGDVVKRILSHVKNATLISSADWSYYSKEINKIIKDKPKAVSLYVPKSCYNNGSKNMNKLMNHYKSWPDCVVPMTYDAILVSLHSICYNKKFDDYSLDELKKIGLVKKYYGVSSTGNFISKYRFDVY